MGRFGANRLDLRGPQRASQFQSKSIALLQVKNSTLDEEENDSSNGYNDDEEDKDDNKDEGKDGNEDDNKHNRDKTIVNKRKV